MNNIFKDLFVLEMTNNHLGSLERGLKIVSEFAKVVKFNNVKAAIKLQFRDVDNFIHKDFKDRKDIRYIRRTIETKMSDQDYEILVDNIKHQGMIPMSTPFDEKSVELCDKLNLSISHYLMIIVCKLKGNISIYNIYTVYWHNIALYLNVLPYNILFSPIVKSSI